MIILKESVGSRLPRKPMTSLKGLSGYLVRFRYEGDDLSPYETDVIVAASSPTSAEKLVMKYGEAVVLHKEVGRAWTESRIEDIHQWYEDRPLSGYNFIDSTGAWSVEGH